MYSSVSNEFKIECKRDVNSYKRIAKIHVVEDNIDITNDNDLVDFTIEETAYSGSTFVGNSVAKKISLNIINDGSYNLEDKEIQVYVGIDYVGDGSNTELIPYGNFIISKPTNEEVKNTSNYIGYDYMIKTEVPYTEDNIVYPISLYNYLSAICTSVGITLGNQTIPNGNYQVLGDAYTNGEKVRQVIEEIARCCGGFAVIGRDNKLYIKTLAIINDNEDETITPGEYYEDFGTNNTYGPVNRVAIALNYNVVGEDTIREDPESIVQNGITEIRVSDISFLNSEAQRELVVDAFWFNLHNLTYKPYSTNYYGYPYVDSGDIVKITKPDNTNIYSYILNHKFTYNGAFSGNIEAPALSDVEDEYKETTDAKSAIRSTELKVDKINGEVQSIITEIGDRSGKTSSITQDIDGINIKISDLEDLTVDVTDLNPLTLENCLDGELIKLNIIGNNTVFNFLAPSDDLYPADDLLPYQENSILKIRTDNKCPTDRDEWEFEKQSEQDEHPFLMRSKNLIPIDKSRTNYFYFKGYNDYYITNVYYYDKDEELIGDYEDVYEEPIESQEWTVVYPNNAVYMKFVIQKLDDGQPEIDYNDFEIDKMKPMLARSLDYEYVHYNNYDIDLEIDEPLRQYSNTVYDEFVYDSEYMYNFDAEDNDEQLYKAYVVRRVGVSQQGTLYPLAQPVIEPKDVFIKLVDGTNYIDLDDIYSATMKATYVQINTFSKVFATEYEMTSQIIQLANQITLLVSEKVGEDEIIAKINLAVENEQGIIEITGNQISITSDYFSLTPDGRIVATAGQIANWTIENGQFKSPYFILNPNGSSSTDWALQVNPNGGFISGYPSFGVRNNGYVYGYSFNVHSPNSSTAGQLDVWNANGKTGTQINGGTIRTGWLMGSQQLGGYIFKGYAMHGGFESPKSSAGPDEWIDTNRYYCHWTNEKLDFNVNGSYIGHAVIDNGSDRRLKADIKEIPDNVMKAISELQFKDYYFKADEKKKRHPGIVAQDLIEIFEENDLDWHNYGIVYEQKREGPDGYTDYYSINYENLDTYVIAYLKKKVEEQDEIIQNLIDNQEKMVQDLIKRIEKLEKGE